MKRTTKPPSLKKKKSAPKPPSIAGYHDVLGDLVALIESSRRAAARAVNAAMTASYFLVGRAIVEHEQRGATRAEYGERLLQQLGADLSDRFGRGFSADNLETMRRFYLAYGAEISETLSRKLLAEKSETPSRKLVVKTSVLISGDQGLHAITARFQLPWSHYVLLVRRSRSTEARAFYETEAIRGGWTVRQLHRQIDTQFYERTALSRNKAAMLAKGATTKREDAVTPEEEIKDPLVLEFLGLKDEYSESQLEEALILRLEHFLLELGGDFAFVGRQRRLRVGDAWYRVDLLFFHRKLRCLVVIDLKLGELTHADAGQMHLYLNYAREHWTHENENPPVGLILCTKKHAAVARYALAGLSNKVLAAEYRTTLPDERLLANELVQARSELEARVTAKKPQPRSRS